MAEIADAFKGRKDITSIIDAVKSEALALPVEPILMYLVDTAPVEALYYLASQLGVLGAAGWRFATTEAQQRELIKSATRLQRTKGTPGAIKDAVRTLGFGEVTITSALGIYYDGTYVADGTILAGAGGGGSWANFRIRIALAPGVEVSPATTEAVTAVVNAYKNARSVLVDISWGINITDTLGGDDVLALGGPQFSENLTGGLLFDGSALADGSTLAGSGPDDLIIRILPA